MNDAEIERRLTDGTLTETKRVRGTPPPSALEDPIGWRKWWLARNRGKTWSDADAAWKRQANCDQ